MRKVLCDICGADLTDANQNSIYKLLLDRDGAPFDKCIDIPDICESCANNINTCIQALCIKKAERSN